jgi:hypothetical protein
MRAGLFRVWASERSVFCRSASKIRRLLRLMIHEEDESAQILILLAAADNHSHEMKREQCRVII